MRRECEEKAGMKRGLGGDSVEREGSLASPSAGEELEKQRKERKKWDAGKKILPMVG